MRSQITPTQSWIKRLSELSCNEEEFNKLKPLYEEDLSESNYIASLKY